MSNIPENNTNAFNETIMAIQNPELSQPNHGTALAASSGPSVTPLEFDVLCSKDKTHSTHTGNRLFRERIDAMKETYRMTKNKQGKMEITKTIVKYLKQHHNTRFLKRDVSGFWTEISDQAARDKVSHALRFATRRDNGNKKVSNSPSNPSGDGMGQSRKPSASSRATNIGGRNGPNAIPPPGIQQAGAPGSDSYGKVVPVEHIEPSKWLLALRQGP